MNYANSARNRVVPVLIPLVSITLLFPSGRVQASLSPSIGATTLCPSAQSGRVIIGPAAANMARVLLADRRMSRGRRFLNNRSLDLDLEDTVVILGNHGERLVFVPFTDGRGEREAYLLHRSKGREEKVTIFTLYIGSRQTGSGRMQVNLVKASYPGLQEEASWVLEEVYVVYDYGEIDYSDYGDVVYADEHGVVASSTDSALKEAQKIVKCTGVACAGAVVRCVLAGPGILKCIMASCVAGGVICILGALLL